MKLRRELELLHSSMLVNNGVLVLNPPKREQFMVMVNGKFGSVISQVLDNLLVRWMLAWLMRSLQVREAVMLR